MKLDQIKKLEEATKVVGTAKKHMSELEKLGELVNGHEFSVTTIDIIPNEKYSVYVKFKRADSDFATTITLGAYGTDGELYPNGRFDAKVFMPPKDRKEVKAMSAMKDTTPEKAIKRISDYFKKNADKLMG